MLELGILFSRATAHFRRVWDLMVGWGQNVRVIPAAPTTEEMRLRLNLIFEEWRELAKDGYGMKIVIDIRDHKALQGLTLDITDPESAALMCIQTAVPNVKEAVDAHSDISVVNEGGLCCMGVPDIPVLEEVDQNNLMKVGRSTIRPEDGKRIKPKDHVPADQGRVLNALIAHHPPEVQERIKLGWTGAVVEVPHPGSAVDPVFVSFLTLTEAIESESPICKVLASVPVGLYVLTAADGRETVVKLTPGPRTGATPKIEVLYRDASVRA